MIFGQKLNSSTLERCWHGLWELRTIRLFGVSDKYFSTSVSPLSRPRELSAEIQPKQQPFNMPPNLLITFPPPPPNESMKPGNIDCARIDQNRLGSVSVCNEWLLRGRQCELIIERPQQIVQRLYL